MLKVTLLLLCLHFHCSQALISCNETTSLPRVCNSQNKPYDRSNPPDPYPFIIDQHMISVDSIDGVNEDKFTITLTIRIYVTWTDERLSLKSIKENDWYHVTKENSQELFFPTLTIINGKVLQASHDYGPHASLDFWLQAPNTFHYEQVLIVEVNCNFQFDEFPFDSQTCDFIYGDFNQEYQYHQLLPPMINYKGQMLNRSRMIKTDHLPFNFVELETLKPYVYAEAGYEYHHTGMKIHLKNRHFDLLLPSYFIPTGCFSLMSLISFTINPDIVPGRLGLLVTLYLIMINVYNSVKAPVRRGHTHIETWMIGAQLPIILAIIEYGCLLAYQKWCKSSCTFKTVDIWAMILLSLFSVGFMTFFWMNAPT